MPTPPPKSAALVAVEKAGKKLARINAQRDTAISELRVALRAADAEGGHTRSDLVAAAGVARQTVYDALRDQPAPELRPERSPGSGDALLAGHGASEGDPAL